MSRWADWFSLDLTEEARLRAAGSADEVVELLESWLERKDDLPLHVEMDKAWEPIHRCLTGDHGAAHELNFDGGAYPLKLCVLGGEPLLHEGYRTATLISREDVPALASALAAVSEDWLRERFHELPDTQFHEIDDESFEWTWELFQMLPPFFAAAARAGDAVVCTISH